MKQTGKGIPNLIVEALDKDFIFDDRLGSVITDKDGRFEILYTKEDFQDVFFERRPDIYLRVRRPDGRVIHTTEGKIRYDAGRVEAFYIDIPEESLEGEHEMNKSNYKIQGRIASETIKAVPGNMPVKIYAFRDRKVLGSSLASENGCFCIEYQYEIYTQGEQRLPLGVYLAVAPDLPDGRILKENFPKVFLPNEAFKETEGYWTATVPETTTALMISRPILDTFWEQWLKAMYREWRPWVRVIDARDNYLKNGHVRIYEPRTSFYPFNLDGKPNPAYMVLVAEGNTDQFGNFKTTKTVLRFPKLYLSNGYLVEVSQCVNGESTILFKDSESKPRELNNDVCEDIHLPSVISSPLSSAGPLTGKVFNITHIGYIPVKCIQNDGYATTKNSSAADDASIPITDTAFYGTLKLYANIGQEIRDSVKYYSISYKVDDDPNSYDILTPFNNLRESTSTEQDSFGPYRTEFMGPQDGKYYEYPNPYDDKEEKNWVYKGLLLVLDTTKLPKPYGLYTFTVDLFTEDLNGNKISIPNLDTLNSRLSVTMLVDNTAPTGSIKDIIGPDNLPVAACGSLLLPKTSEMIGYDPCLKTYSRTLLNGAITVNFGAQDGHGNIQRIELYANFGCNEQYKLVTYGENPTNGYQNYDQVPSDGDDPNNPHKKWFGGREDYCKTRNGEWHECAYEFLLTIYKRVTNGENIDPYGNAEYPWWNFTKHITITQNKSV